MHVLPSLRRVPGSILAPPSLSRAVIFVSPEDSVPLRLQFYTHSTPKRHILTALFSRFYANFRCSGPVT